MNKGNSRFHMAIITIAFALLTGCAGTMNEFFNPYDEEFACPFSDPGQCSSMKQAYDASLADGEKEEFESVSTQCPSGDCQDVPSIEVSAATPKKKGPSSKQVYKERQFETIAALIQEEEPPVVIPPEVLRVLILSYTGSENEMFGFRYAYFFATDPKWMLSTATFKQ